MRSALAQRFCGTGTRSAAAGLVIAFLVLAGCGEDVDELTLGAPDRVAFETQVYPILLRDCGFHACHGSHERFFQVFGPGHGRLRPETEPAADLTPEENEHNFQRARSMLDPADPTSSLLLRKPLAAGAGGAGHQGVDRLGRDVYQDRIDPSYLVLQRWALTLQPATPVLP